MSLWIEGRWNWLHGLTCYSAAFCGLAHIDSRILRPVRLKQMAISSIYPQKNISITCGRSDNNDWSVGLLIDSTYFLLTFDSSNGKVKNYASHGTKHAVNPNLCCKRQLLFRESSHKYVHVTPEIFSHFHCIRFYRDCHKYILRKV